MIGASLHFCFSLLVLQIFVFQAAIGDQNVDADECRLLRRETISISNEGVAQCGNCLKFYASSQITNSSRCWFSSVSSLTFDASYPLDWSMAGQRFSVSMKDLNRNGLLDMVIGSEAGNLVVFENVGNETDPAFRIMSPEDSPLGHIDIGADSTSTFCNWSRSETNEDILVGDETGKINLFRRNFPSDEKFERVSHEMNPFSFINLGESNGGFSVPACIDANNDGHLDVVVSSADGSIFLYESLGNGTFAKAEQNPFTSIGPRATVSVADLNNDSYMDIIAGEELGVLNFFKNEGNGQFTFTSSTSTENPFFGVDVGWRAQAFCDDFNRDGIIDCVVSEWNGIYLLENDGNLTHPSFKIATNDNAFWKDHESDSSLLALYDFDGDGKKDLFYGFDGSNFRPRLFRNENTQFTRLAQDQNPLQVMLAAWESHANVFDFDGDGDGDIFLGHADGIIEFWENIGNHTHPNFILNQTKNPLFHLSGLERTARPTFVNWNASQSVDDHVDGVFICWWISSTNEAKILYLDKDDGGNFLENPDMNPFQNMTFPASVSVSVCDFDMDGDVDIFVTPWGFEPFLFRNDGEEGFVDVSRTRINPFYSDAGTNIFLVVICTFYDDDEAPDLLGTNWETVQVLTNNVGKVPTTSMFSKLNSDANPLSSARSGTETTVSLVGENKLDVIIGDIDGTIQYLKHLGLDEIGNPIYEISNIDVLNEIDVGSYSRVCGGEGNDIFIGNSDGQVVYLKFVQEANEYDLILQNSTENPFFGIAFGERPTLAIFDVNNDGLNEAFVANRDGTFRSFAWNETGLRFYELLDSDNFFQDADVGSEASINFADFDHDGIPEAILGNNNGMINYIPNRGTSAYPDFYVQWIPILDIEVTARRNAVCSDFDLDGDIDCLTGEASGLNYFKNTARECSTDCTFGRGQCAQNLAPEDPMVFLVSSFHDEPSSPGLCLCKPQFQGSSCEQCAPTFFGIECDQSCPEHSRTQLKPGEKVYPSGPKIDDCLCDASFERVEISEENDDDDDDVSNRFVCQCPPGSSYDQVLGVCLECGLNSFKNTSSNTLKCESCSNHDPFAITLEAGSSDVSDCTCRSPFVQEKGSFPCLCPQGMSFFSSEEISTCLECEIGTFQENLTLSPECKSCTEVLGPRGTTLVRGAKSASDCVCAASFVALDGECVCQPGTGFVDTLNICETCPLGYISSIFSLDPCTPCSVATGDNFTTTSSSGSKEVSSCICDQNLVRESGNGTCSCGVGYGFDGVSCTLCKEGYFSDEFNLEPCKSCANVVDPRAITVATGSTNIAACVCPSSFSFHEVNGCVCEAGKGFDQESNICVQCDVGFFSETQDLSECLPCSALLGGFATTSAKGSTSSEECICQGIMVESNSSCVCPLGHHFDNVSMACAKCNIGSYNNQLGGTCQECPPYSTTAGSGSVSSGDCICKDTFSWDADGNCSCASGWGLSEGGATCEQCPISTFSELYNLESCRDCSNVLGQFATTSTRGSTSSNQCQCSISMISNGTDCVCDLGYGFDSENRVCSECGIGFFNGNRDLSKCDSCQDVLVGSVTELSGASSSSLCSCPRSMIALNGTCGCEAGFGWQPDSGICERCLPGTFSPSFSIEGACQQCPENHTSSAGDPTFCFTEFCPAGTERVSTSGSQKCTPCPESTFREALEQTNECQRCPDSRPFTNKVGSSSKRDCLPGFGSFLTDPDEEPLSCEMLEGVDCDQVGLTLETLPVVETFWRISNLSVDIRKCPEEDFCRPERRLTDQENQNQYCSPFHVGVYCARCTAGYSLKGGACSECEEKAKRRDVAMFAFAVMLLALIIIAPSVRVSRLARETVTQTNRRKATLAAVNIKRRTKRKYLKWARMPTLKESSVKIKILYGTFQIANKYVRIVGMLKENALPLTQTVFDFDPSRFFISLEIGCFKTFSFYQGLLLSTLFLPLSIICLGWTSLMIRKFWGQDFFFRSVGESAQLMTTMLLVAYPSISSTITQTFIYDSIERFAGDPSPVRVLKFDFQHDFDSEESHLWQIYAGLMILVYPIGVLVYFIVGVRLKQNIEAKSSPSELETVISSKLTILEKGYKAERTWFEAYEMGRKLVLTAGMLLFFQASAEVSKVLFSCIVSFCLFVLGKTSPYLDFLDQAFAEMSLVVLLLLGCVSLTLVLILLTSAELIVFFTSLVIRWYMNCSLEFRILCQAEEQSKTETEKEQEETKTKAVSKNAETASKLHATKVVPLSEET